MVVPKSRSAVALPQISTPSGPTTRTTSGSSRSRRSRSRSEVGSTSDDSGPSVRVGIPESSGRSEPHLEQAPAATAPAVGRRQGVRCRGGHRRPDPARHRRGRAPPRASAPGPGATGRPGAWAATTPTSPTTRSVTPGTPRIDAGVTLFDTAEIYGEGESERIIGSLLAGDPGRAARAVIATKFMPSPRKLNVRRALLSSLRASLEPTGPARPSTSTRSTDRSASAPIPCWPTRSPPPTTRVWSGRSGCRTTRSRRPGPWPTPSDGTASAWRRTRSSSPCSAAPPRPGACWPPVPTSGSCPSPTRPSARAG